jgi:hypothetical protein
MDYLWLATNDSLFRFDKLGREWISYSLPEKSDIKALQSDGVNVECLGGNNAFSFVVNTEKWNSYSTNTNFTDSVSFYHGMKSLIALTDKRIFVYNSGAHLWEKNEINNSITDFFVDDTVMIYAAGDRLMRLSDGVSRSIDIPNNGQIYALGKSSDTLFIALKSGIMKYNLRNSGISLIEYPLQAQEFPEKVIVKKNFIIALYSNTFAIYNNESKTWSISGKVENKSLTKVSWEEQGPFIQYKPGFFTNLKGSVESKKS